MTTIDLPDPVFEWATYRRRTDSGSSIYVTELQMGNEVLFTRETPESSWDGRGVPDPIIDGPDDAEAVAKAEFADKFRRLFA